MNILDEILIEGKPTDNSVVIQIGPNGAYSTHILADSSAEEDILRERLVAALPALEMLRTILTGEYCTDQVMP
ncbi:MAG: hypothetical protein ABIU05_18105 [Nitrospirales bacterium]